MLTEPVPMSCTFILVIGYNVIFWVNTYENWKFRPGQAWALVLRNLLTGGWKEYDNENILSRMTDITFLILDTWKKQWWIWMQQALWQENICQEFSPTCSASWQHTLQATPTTRLLAAWECSIWRHGLYSMVRVCFKLIL